MVGFLLFAAYQYRVLILQQVVPSFATYYGVHVHDLELDRVDTDKIIIKHVMLSKQDNNSKIVITIKNLYIGLTVSLQDVFKISSIEGDYAGINIEASVSQQNNSTGLQLRDYIGYLPAHSIEISKIQLNYSVNQISLANFNGELSSHQKLQLVGSIKYHNITADLSLILDEERS